MSALLGPAGAILLAACYGAPGRYGMSPNAPQGATRVDRDGDGAPGGYECASYAGPSCQQELGQMPPPPDIDCDDADRTRYPGAQDVEGDGIDQNCDGVDGWRDGNTSVRPTYATPPPGAGSGATIAVPPEPAP